MTYKNKADAMRWVKIAVSSDDQRIANRALEIALVHMPDDMLADYYEMLAQVLREKDTAE